MQRIPLYLSKPIVGTTVSTLKAPVSRFMSDVCCTPPCPSVAKQECYKKVLQCQRAIPKTLLCNPPKVVKLGKPCGDRMCMSCCLPVEKPVTNIPVADPRQPRCIQQCPHPAFAECNSWIYEKSRNCRGGIQCMPDHPIKCMGECFNMPSEHPLTRQHYINKQCLGCKDCVIMPKKQDPCCKDG